MGNMFELETKKVLAEAAQKAMEVLNQEVIISVSRECLQKLDENEVFAAATKEGITREFLKSMVVPALNHLIDNLNLEKFNNSMTKALILDEKIDLTAFTGEDIFDVMDSAGAFEKVYEPEFKKQIIFNEAVELATQKGNISMNTAIKRVIADMESADYIDRQIEKANKIFDQIASIINSILEFYLEHEVEIILRIAMSKK